MLWLKNTISPVLPVQEFCASKLAPDFKDVTIASLARTESYFQHLTLRTFIAMCISKRRQKTLLLGGGNKDNPLHRERCALGYSLYLLGNPGMFEDYQCIIFVGLQEREPLHHDKVAHHREDLLRYISQSI